MLLLQHLERCPQWRPQPKARATESNGDLGLEWVARPSTITPSSSWLSASMRQREASSLLLAAPLAERVAHAAIAAKLVHARCMRGVNQHTRAVSKIELN